MGLSQGHGDAALSLILSCQERVVVLTGPARAGKTSAALAVVEHYLGERGFPSCVLLAPNRLAVDDLRRRLLERSPTGTLAQPRVETFQTLSGRILLGRGDEPDRPGLTPVQREVVLKGILTELARRRRLTAFARVADAPGLAGTVGGAIAELQRAGVAPEAYARAIGSAGGRHRDLLEVYRAYQRYLAAAGVEDEEGRLARTHGELMELLSRREEPPFGSGPQGRGPLTSLRALVADGFAELSGRQVELLRLLSGHLEKLVITLTLADEPRRQRLWRGPGEQIERFRRAFAAGGGVRVIAPERSAKLQASEGGAPKSKEQGAFLTPSLDRLFDLDAAPAAPPEGLSFVSAAGVESECRAIARWAKAHLLQGSPPHDLAVVARRIDPYLPELARAFAQAGLPPPAWTRPLNETPLGRLLLSLIRMAERFDHASVLEVISHSYLRPPASVGRNVPGPDGAGPSSPPLPGFSPDLVAVAELIIRQGNVLEGRERYARAARDLVRRIGPADEPDAEEDEADDFSTPLEKHLRRLGPQAIEQASAMLQSLFDLVAPIAAGGTLAQLANACLTLMDALGFDAAARFGKLTAPSGAEGRNTEDLAASAADLRSLSAIREVLRGLAGLNLSAIDAAVQARRSEAKSERTLSAAEFAAALARALGETLCPAEQPTDAVLALDAADARPLRPAHVWLAGVNQGVFPPPGRDEPLITEDDREAWAALPLPRDRRDNRLPREMLLFYLALGRAERSLTVSWLHTDTAGRSLAPSSFVEALGQAIGGLAGRVTVLPLGQFAPPPAEILSRRELLNTALASAGATGDDPRASELAPALQAAGAAFPNLLRPLAWPIWASYRRWRPALPDAYDGVLSDPGLLAELARLVPAETVFSVSQINTYLDCPWRYFALWWLRLAPLPEVTEALLPRNRGLLVHEVLRRMFARLAEAGPVTPGRLAGAEGLSALEAAIQAERDRAGPQAYSALWEAQLAQVRRAVELYLRRQLQLAPAHREAIHLELGFGLPLSRTTDPASSPDPLVLDGPAGSVRLCGKIDRVDRTAGDDGPGVFVVDYKTGQVPSVEGDVQLPVYMRAAERMTSLPAVGGAFHAVRLRNAKDAYLAPFRAGGAAEPDGGERFRQRVEGAMALLHQAVGAIAAGRFDVMPAHGCSQAQCPLRRACGYSESRALFKAPPEGAGEPAGDAAEGNHD